MVECVHRRKLRVPAPRRSTARRSRTAFHYFATVITPAMAHAQVGAGSAYAYTARDANGDLLDGAKAYTLTLPADPPAKNFWSVERLRHANPLTVCRTRQPLSERHEPR